MEISLFTYLRIFICWMFFTRVLFGSLCKQEYTYLFTYFNLNVRYRTSHVTTHCIVSHPVRSSRSQENVGVIKRANIEV